MGNSESLIILLIFNHLLPIIMNDHVIPLLDRDEEIVAKLLEHKLQLKKLWSLMIQKKLKLV